ncbi:MAG TPA: hypothetical protein VK137_10655 [Planctomycetaceae bacterium]|nr:hypothetical protein [Planctomycetaceae bacterium]
MALSTDLEILNRVLRDLSSCFVQYVGDCWPWTSIGSDGDKLQAVVRQCVARQRQSIERIAEHLASRQSRVEYGRFSTDFTNMHYVSLQFLVKQLVAAQTRLAESLDRTITLLPNGDEAREILEDVRHNEHENLTALQACRS